MNRIESTLHMLSELRRLELQKRRASSLAIADNQSLFPIHVIPINCGVFDLQNLGLERYCWPLP